MKPGFLFNTSSGGLINRDADTVVEEVIAPFRSAGHQCEVCVVDSETLMNGLESLTHKCDTIFVGGGDGSVTAAAARLATTNKTLGILPFGTMNLVARDIGLLQWSRDIGKRLVHGRRRTIDIAEVNGQPFLHSVVLGTFAEIAGKREKLRGASDAWGWPQFLAATSNSLLSGEPRSFHIRTNRKTHIVRTRSILVSNNKIVDRLRLGLTREGLDRGMLYVYVPRDRTALDTVGMLVRFVSGLWNADPFLKKWKTPEASIFLTGGQTVKVSIDGEIRDLEMPLTFRNRRKALNLWVPAQV